MSRAAVDRDVRRVVDLKWRGAQGAKGIKSADHDVVRGRHEEAVSARFSQIDPGFTDRVGGAEEGNGRSWGTGPGDGDAGVVPRLHDDGLARLNGRCGGIDRAEGLALGSAAGVGAAGPAALLTYKSAPAAVPAPAVALALEVALAPAVCAEAA